MNFTREKNVQSSTFLKDENMLDIVDIFPRCGKKEKSNFQGYIGYFDNLIINGTVSSQ